MVAKTTIVGHNAWIVWKRREETNLMKLSYHQKNQPKESIYINEHKEEIRGKNLEREKVLFSFRILDNASTGDTSNFISRTSKFCIHVYVCINLICISNLICLIHARIWNIIYLSNSICLINARLWNQIYLLWTC